MRYSTFNTVPVLDSARTIQKPQTTSTRPSVDINLPFCSFVWTRMREGYQTLHVRLCVIV